MIETKARQFAKHEPGWTGSSHEESHQRDGFDGLLFVIQALPQGVQENMRRAGLVQDIKLVLPEKVPVRARYFRTVTTDEDGFQLWSLRPQLFRQFAAGDSVGQDHVCQQQINFFGMIAPESQRFSPSSRFPNVVTEGFEHPLRGQPNREVVFYEQNPFGTSARRRFGLLGSGAGEGRWNDRQENSERCARADVGRYLDPTLVLFDDAMNRGQAEASALCQVPWC